MTSDATDGLYQPGQSVLHHLDPRVKMTAALVVVMLGFAASSWWQLAVLLVLGGCATVLFSPAVPSVLSLLARLRWLLLFTLLIYLFFSPGRTLWGVTWLSLDGLLAGIFVCLQMTLAVQAAVVVAVTTPLEALAGAFGWFVSPLARLGCRTDEWQEILLMALGFLPLVQAETRAARDAQSPRVEKARSLQAFGPRWLETLRTVLQRLLDQADQTAHRLAADLEPQASPTLLPPIWPLPPVDRRAVASLVVIVAVYFGMA